MHFAALVVGSYLCVAGQIAAQNSAATQQEEVLLLKDGRLIEGVIRRVGSEYQVHKQPGVIPVKGDDVEGVFPDAHAAYLHRRRQLSGGEAREYVELALWCLRYNLFDEARDSVRQALLIDPHNDRYHRLMRQIDRQEQLARRTGTGAATTGLRPAGHVLQPTTESVRPVPQAAIAMFARRVQPLVSRRCAAASCHGPRSSRSFQLWPSFQPFPAITDYNVRQLIRFVDRERPEQSILLLKAITAHGGATSPPLPRRTQDPAFEVLYEWVKTAASHTPSESGKDPVTSPNIDTPASPADQPPATPSPPLLPAPAEPTDEGQTPPPPPAPTANEGREEDPFDPAEFNEKYLQEDGP